MRVLGIDCGTQHTGYGLIASDGRSPSHDRRRFDHIPARRIRSKRAWLAIAQGLREVIGNHSPDSAAVEAVFYAQNVKTALKLSHVRGVVLFTIAEAGLAVGEYSPLEIKTSVVGYGRAEKQQVKLMVHSLLGLETELESEDACDAVAVAICHATHAAFRAASGNTAMNRLAPLLLFFCAVAPAAPRLFYSKYFKGSVPEFTCDHGGALRPGHLSGSQGRTTIRSASR